MTLRATALTWALLFCLVVEVAAVPFLWLDPPRNPMKPVVMAVLAALTGLAAWRFSRVVEVSATRVRSLAWFGRGPEVVHDLAAASGIRLQANSNGRVTRLKLAFTDGRSLELNRFQDGFDTAQALLLSSLSHLQPVRESRWF